MPKSYEIEGVRPGQYRLWHLFALTTCAAVATALARTLGPGTLPVSLGFSIAGLNVLGVFRNLQTGPTRLAVLAAAWLAFLASFALPSVQIFGPVFGYGAAWLAILLPWNALIGNEQVGPGIVIYLAIDAANVLMALLPLVAWRLHRGRGERLGNAIALAAAWPWCMGWGNAMLVGYYVWCASFALALLATPLRKWTLVAMAAEASLFALLARFAL